MRDVLEAHMARVAEEGASLAAAIAEADRGEVVDIEEIRAEDELYRVIVGVSTGTPGCDQGRRGVRSRCILRN